MICMPLAAGWCPTDRNSVVQGRPSTCLVDLEHGIVARTIRISARRTETFLHISICKQCNTVRVVAQRRPPRHASVRLCATPTGSRAVRYAHRDGIANKEPSSPAANPSGAAQAELESRIQRVGEHVRQQPTSHGRRDSQQLGYGVGAGRIGEGGRDKARLGVGRFWEGNRVAASSKMTSSQNW
jgi:hypothetical protein